MLPDDVTGDELDADARAGLRSLPKDLATRVARHLVMAGRLADEDAERAYAHARAARRVASRVGIVREAAGLAAYHAGEWSEALAELRAARRLGAGDDSYLPVMADSERGLGRPERALDLVKSPDADRLDDATRVELRIVESGARRDLEQYDAAVVTLQIPELRDRRLRPWSARLFYAYADALVEAGRDEEASDWFARAAAADRDAETDAAERYAELEGLEIVDTEEEDGETPAAGEGADDVASVIEETAAEAAGPADDSGETGEGADDVAPVAERTAVEDAGDAGEDVAAVEAEAAADVPPAVEAAAVDEIVVEEAVVEDGTAEDVVVEETVVVAEPGDAASAEPEIAVETVIDPVAFEFKPEVTVSPEPVDDVAAEAPAVFLEPEPAPEPKRDPDERPGE
ncbi:hypothetical protein [Actinomadura atramentaria]|uniref:hypothetical protein n=1 Tax=Actinomadura atramentaria TaxID=1990 RepID=UPI00036E5056|nr:hypothetical protein [Actinomadura atramentaria]